MTALPLARPARAGLSLPWRHLLAPAAVAPLVLFMIAFYVVPLGLMLLRSVSEPEWTLANLERVVTNTIYVRSFWITLKISGIVTFFTLLLALPVAYVFRTLSRSTVNLLMILVLLPLWTSVLIRTFAWVVILGRTGLVNQALLGLGLVDQPVRLLNTTLAVYLAMVHIMLPYMILPVYAVVKSIDESVIRAALGLGARPMAVFFQVILPLALPGILAGCLLVFILSIGMFITPALIGGAQDLVVSMLIQQQVDISNWPFASALSGVLLLATLLILYAGARLVGVPRLLASLGR